jgi:cysteine desulfurase
MNDNDSIRCGCQSCGPLSSPEEAGGARAPWPADIYMDHNATTPIDDRVLAAMMPCLTTEFGNAASTHAFGQRARNAVEAARAQVAAAIGAVEKEIVFTSGATESDNLAIKGALAMYAAKGNHVITSRAEHKAVLDVCKHLEEQGAAVTYLETDEFGRVNPEAVAAAITDKTVLISLMLANNEIGTLNPIAAIGRIAKDRGVIFHTDATQAVGRVPIDVAAMGVDLLSLSAHKLYGPKGVGALYVRARNPRVRLSCQLDGGGHERGLRSGTLNVPGIVGLGAACEIAIRQMPDDARRIGALRDRLEKGILQRVEHTKVNGHPTERLFNTTNISFAYIEGEGMMLRMPRLAVSTGSACSSATLEPSHVLKAIGVGDDMAHGSIRFSLGRRNTADEVDAVIAKVAEVAEVLRQMSPLYEMAQEGIDLSQVKWTEH